MMCPALWVLHIHTPAGIRHGKVSDGATGSAIVKIVAKYGKDCVPHVVSM